MDCLCELRGHFISVTIRTRQEIQRLPYVGFFFLLLEEKEEKNAVQAVGAEPLRCNSTNRQSPTRDTGDGSAVDQTI